MATLILTLLFVLAVVVSAVFGLIRGLNKSVIRLMTLALAVILTFLIAGPVTNLVAGSITVEGKALSEMILESVATDEMTAMIFETVPLLREAILVIPAFVISIVVFPVVFGVIKFLTWIGFLFAQKPLRKLIFKDNCDKEEYAALPKKNRLINRFAGMGVGIVTGVLIFGMIFTPVFGLFGMLPAANAMSNTLNALVEQDAFSAEDAEMIQSIYDVTDNALTSVYGAFGAKAAGKAYLNSVSRIEADGIVTSLGNEFDNLLGLVQTMMQSGLLTDMQNPDYVATLFADPAALEEMMQSLLQSKILASAVPNIMASAVEGIATDMNMPANKDAVYDTMMDNVSSAVREADIDYAALKAYEDAHGSAFSLIRLSTAKTSTNGARMTEAEYEAEIQKLVDLAKKISNVINKALSGSNTAFTDSIAAHIVNEVKAQASENGQAVIENFDAVSVQNALSTVNVADIDAGEGDAAAMLQQLTDKEKFETNIPTIEVITKAIREAMKFVVADESKAAETASTLVSVATDFADAISAATDNDGNLDIAKLDFTKIGKAVTKLQNSPLKGVGSCVLDLIGAVDMGDNGMISGVIEAVKDGYEKGEDVGGTIGAAGALIGIGSAMGNTDADNQEAVVNSLTGLIENLNEFTISLLPTIFSDETVASMGIPAEFADATYKVVETLLKELMKLKGAEDYDNEVNAILTFYSMVTSGADNFTENTLAELMNYAQKSDAIFNTLKSISTSNPFGIEIEDAQTREEIAGAIEQIFAKGDKTQRARESATAIANLLGVAEVLDLG